MQLVTKDTNLKIEVSDDIFAYHYNEGLVHQAVTTFLNNARSGNSAQKSRSEVSGGGKKPWNQKGTGRARAGTIRSPLWRTGGVTFASKKRDYSQKINRKMYKRAMRSILSEMQRRGSLLVVSDFQCSTHKTKDFMAKMKELNLENALVVLNEVGEHEYLSSRNLINYDVSDVAGLDPVCLLKFKNILMTEEAIKKLEEQLQ
ncbi:50S ribosomal protein L4 [Legionella londiniensis]|uniref:Large ribosomal subunit protein uL4 n=1 Tax=Legionella londiniensis TaxID=45068 RepID=A0A0W0VT20_9GAMM|nr:50S ribosomal protein L4 [Legionella londiniensis]KTD23278.1 50S ribosomal protein L4 [Legionella londiniensis]STX94167.1 50S ribosomal protein L4 [Legionella londiniensis]